MEHDSSHAKFFGLNFTSHYIPEFSCSSQEAKCVSFSRVRISHRKQTPGTVLLHQIRSQKHMTGLNRPPFKRLTALTARLQHKAHSSPLFNELIEGDLLSLVKMLGELLLLKAPKLLLMDSAREKPVDGFICFLMDFTRISGEIWFYHSHKNYGRSGKKQATPSSYLG